MSRKQGPTNVVYPSWLVERTNGRNSFRQFNLKEWNSDAVTDDMKSWVLANYPSLQPHKEESASVVRGNKRRKFVRENPDAEFYPRRPTLDPINQAMPLLGVHIGEIKGIVSHGMTSVNQHLHQMNCRLNQICQMMHNQQALNLQMQHVLASTASAHLTSPYRPSVTGDMTQNHVTTQVSPGTDGNTQQHSVESPEMTMEPVNLEATFPMFERLAYHSLEHIHDDWFGSPSSPFHQHGGLKALYTNRSFRKFIATDKQKREADKKMLQKMRRIGDYFEAQGCKGHDKEQVIKHIRSLISQSPKNNETLTGVDQLLTKEQKSRPS